MSLLRQFSSIARKLPGKTPLITFENATVYPLGETVSPYFQNLTWRINEGESWAVVGPSSPGRKVLLEVLNPEYSSDLQLGPSGFT
jgi:ABC-type molybdenum transport system ATPase subunit/photorepair protein PhrA